MDSTHEIDFKLQKALTMSMGPEGFDSELNESNANLNDFSEMVRSRSTATTTNFEEDDQGPETVQNDDGKLLFPGQ